MRSLGRRKWQPAIHIGSTLIATDSRPLHPRSATKRAVGRQAKENVVALPTVQKFTVVNFDSRGVAKASRVDLTAEPCTRHLEPSLLGRVSSTGTRSERPSRNSGRCALRTTFDLTCHIVGTVCGLILLFSCGKKILTPRPRIEQTSVTFFFPFRFSPSWKNNPSATPKSTTPSQLLSL